MPNLRWQELLIIVALVLLLFGAKRLPDAARGLGRSLRIFKAETKGLVDGEEDGETQEMPLPVLPPRRLRLRVRSNHPRAMRPLQTLVPSNTILVSVPRNEQRLSTPVAVQEQGNEQQAAMPLTEHLRELRSRLVKSGIAVVVGMVVGWIAYPTIFELLSQPFEGAVEQAQKEVGTSPLPSPG